MICLCNECEVVIFSLWRKENVSNMDRKNCLYLVGQFLGFVCFIVDPYVSRSISIYRKTHFQSQPYVIYLIIGPILTALILYSLFSNINNLKKSMIIPSSISFLICSFFMVLFLSRTINLDLGHYGTIIYCAVCICVVNGVMNAYKRKNKKI